MKVKIFYQDLKHGFSYSPYCLLFPSEENSTFD